MRRTYYVYNSVINHFFSVLNHFDEGRIFFYWGELDYWVDLYGTNEFLDFILYETKRKQERHVVKLLGNKFIRLRVICICFWYGWRVAFFFNKEIFDYVWWLTTILYSVLVFSGFCLFLHVLTIINEQIIEICVKEAGGFSLKKKKKPIPSQPKLSTLNAVFRQTINFISTN